MTKEFPTSNDESAGRGVYCQAGVRPASTPVEKNTLELAKAPPPRQCPHAPFGLSHFFVIRHSSFVILPKSLVAASRENAAN
jgi:hypothetical protein